MTKCFIDHIAVTAPTLAAGAEFVKRALGITLQKGGEHPRMGTHNLLLRLGESVYLEVISCNPDAEKPDRPRWFALDDMNDDTPAALTTWVARTEDIYATQNSCSEHPGKIEPMSRGKNDWLITIPEDGSLPVNEGGPSLIQWKTESHPAAGLEDHGLSLIKLQIFNPEAERVSNFLRSINLEGDVEVLQSSESKLIASIRTPHGDRELSS